jgi:hypothetical protein
MVKRRIAGIVALAAMVAMGLAAPQAGWAAKDDHAHGHESHGEKKDLGTTTVAGLKLKVAQMGEAKAGTEGFFEIALEKGQAKPKALRCWVGNAAAEGSVKTKGSAEEGVYDLHVEIPKKLSANSQFWIDIESAEGKRAKAAFDLKK